MFRYITFACRQINSATILRQYVVQHQHNRNRIVNIIRCTSTAPRETTTKTDTSEKNFLLRVKNDQNVFGKVTRQIESEEDRKENEYIENKPPRRLSTKQYADLIKSFLRKKKVKEAIDVLEVKMLKDDRAKPENYIYNLLISACGTAGYTKKAFQLYNDMKKRDLQVTGATYTALFNSCANSPWPTTDGLTRAKHLYDTMIERRYEPNETNYNVMIKAFGRGGDLQTAFGLADEMIGKRMDVKETTLNFLLQACVGDETAGFRHALLVWRQFVKKNIRPNVFSYNLLLRCTRDCNLGTVAEMEDVVGRITSDNPQATIGAGSSLEMITPNLIAETAHMGSVLTVTEVVKPEDRFLLLGGIDGFLSDMKEKDVAPNIKTFTQLLDVVPSSIAAESDLLTRIKKSKLRLDVDFFNMLIKRRCLRMDYDAAKLVLPMLEKKGLKPNVMTFGLLAMTCRNWDEAQFLLQCMEENGYRTNTEIIGTMLKNACFLTNFQYVFAIMDLTTKQQISPNKQFLKHLEDFKKKCKNVSNLEKTNQNFQEKHKIFRMKYKTWLTEITPDRTEEQHPWQQYRQESSTQVKHTKQSGSKFKPVHKSLFRQKLHRNNKS